MVSLVLRALAFFLFLLAGFNQTVFGQPELDLIAFGLSAWVLATLLVGYGPSSPWVRGQ
jgi:hypothetical protein